MRQDRNYKEESKRSRVKKVVKTVKYQDRGGTDGSFAAAGRFAVHSEKPDQRALGPAAGPGAVEAVAATSASSRVSAGPGVAGDGGLPSREMLWDAAGQGRTPGPEAEAFG